MSEADTAADKPSPGLELLRITSLLAAVVAQLFLASRIAKVPPDYCFTRPFWLDEFHTLAVVSEERADQLYFKLAHGGDFNPPGLHFPLWVITKVTSLSDEVLFRSFSCFAGAAGLVATYFLLRTRFPWRVSWVGVLGMLSSSPQLLQQMFEARTYSFWFAAIALFCLLLGLRTTGSWRTVSIAAMAAAMCSIHYFGILVLGLVGVSQLCCNFQDVRQRRLVGAAFAAGVITVIAWLPLYLSQRQATPVPTWISPPTLGGSAAFIGGFIATYALALPVLACAVQLLLGKSSNASSESVELKVYAGACSLILWPVVLTVFSYAIQPAQLARYAVPTALAYAPLIALISRRLNRAMLEGMALLFFVTGLGGALVVYERRPDYREAVSLVKASSFERPLVVHWRVVAYPLFRYTDADPNAIHVSYLFRGNPLSRFDGWEQAMTRRMGDLFNFPKTLELDELASLDEFYLLVGGGEEARYPGWTAEPLGAVMGPLRGYKMVRSPDASPQLEDSGPDSQTPR